MTQDFNNSVSVGASVFTIAAMSIDRYLAIEHSMSFRKVLNRKSTIYVILALWLVSMTIFGPVLWVRQTESVELGDDPILIDAVHRYGLAWCIEDWGNAHAKSTLSKHVYGILCFVLVYATPGFLVTGAYTLMGRRLWAVRPPFDDQQGMISVQQVRMVRERRRVARILFVLAVIFALCWLPYNLLTLFLDLDITLDKFGLDQEYLMKWYPFTLLLGHANSAINPLLYCFMTRNFRRTIKGFVCNTGIAKPRRRNRCKKGLTEKSTTSGYGSFRNPRRLCFTLAQLRQNNTVQTRTATISNLAVLLKYMSIFEQKLLVHNNLDIEYRDQVSQINYISLEILVLAYLFYFLEFIVINISCMTFNETYYFKVKVLNYEKLFKNFIVKLLKLMLSLPVVIVEPY
ncbi:hypothetical protein AGLY_007902 [Aphis glycines]|uniref:G-protein coupled receptors family 1 profile domain-containing protein n=1 Tax=Aphis glycines TaxID=307491 RepID=A0A6G0TNS7_APHGL|nr:hypothetical protein AGLY_007902 [Aphis glycines]